MLEPPELLDSLKLYVLACLSIDQNNVISCHQEEILVLQLHGLEHVRLHYFLYCRGLRL